MHGLTRRVDANSLSLFSQPPFAKPGIVFSTFGKLILREPVVCKRKIKRDFKVEGGKNRNLFQKKERKNPEQDKRGERRKKRKKKSACH